jgi:hypothetical protein
MQKSPSKIQPHLLVFILIRIPGRQRRFAGSQQDARSKGPAWQFRRSSLDRQPTASILPENNMHHSHRSPHARLRRRDLKCFPHVQGRRTAQVRGSGTAPGAKRPHAQSGRAEEVPTDLHTADTRSERLAEHPWQRQAKCIDCR